MSDDERYENRAGEDFMEHKRTLAEEEKRRFVNTREAVLDVLVAIEREHTEMKWARKLKKRVLESRSESELRIVMDGMLVLAGFAVRPQP
jgi:hypothetical protein